MNKAQVINIIDVQKEREKNMMNKNMKQDGRNKVFIQ